MNRLWERFFGIGLVKTSDDFGFQGEAPSHPELLDWLATEFIRRGWDVKAMQKLIVMSATYRQSAEANDEIAPVVGPIYASNSWVVDGRHSASGKPLLANDPHLGTRLPSTWYLAHISAPGFDVIGATLPGAPAVQAPGTQRHRGEASLLTGPGLGVRVVEERLRRHAVAVRDLR